MHLPNTPHAVLAAAAFALLLSACGKAPQADPEETARAILPVGQVAIEKVKVEPGKRTGEEIVTAVCGACHSSGALNAPKTGDKEAWAPRIAQGFDALVQAAINGKNQMPARGGAADLTDEEVARAVAYLANQSGASFEAPAP
ncbi:MAG: cytochrome c5 family protein [Rhodocyclaceae bacterium]|nr:cytochrome c5 family protein [Rhodocyclaceae bacterium]